MACFRSIAAYVRTEKGHPLRTHVRSKTPKFSFIGGHARQPLGDRMWCEENSLNAIKARGFSDALIANQRRYNLESTNNIVNSSGRRVRGFVGIEALVQPDLTPNSWRA